MTFRNAIAAAVLFVPSTLAAQLGPPPTYGEARIDVLVGRNAALEGGAGVVLPLGNYVRFGFAAAAGATWRDGSGHASGRVDAISRFLLDPFRETAFGFSLGGGISVPFVEGDKRVRPYLTAVMDIEGRMRGSVTPALQIGLGGGARVGIVLRTSPGRWR